MAATKHDPRDRPLFVNGEWLETGEWADVSSPYSGKTVGRVAVGGTDETRAAVDAAERAMETPIPQHERVELLTRIAEALAGRQDETARLISDEAGKPMKAARAEANRAVQTYLAAAAAARSLSGETIPLAAAPSGAGKLGLTIRVPIGVVGAISPFNFPLNLVAHKLAPALAAGCAVVLKPAMKTPLSAFLLAEVSTEAGLPAGWLNVVCGASAPIGDVLIDDDRVKAITFTGSGPVGWALRARAPRKHVALELGNSTPLIVAADADVAAASSAAAAGAFSYAGQSCISVQRIFAHRDIYDEFVAQLVTKVEKLVVGDPADEATDVGPVIDAGNRDRLLEWIAAAGGEVLTGGSLTADGLLRPTVIGSPALDAEVSCNEAFGPICTVQPYDTADEAFERANSTDFGLQAGIFTSDIRLALRAARELEFAGVTVNESPTWRVDHMPYGGIKDSGNTREGPLYAMREFTDERLVVLDLGD